jgi:hypothetical protein
MKEVVSIEKATEEVNAWLDAKKIFPSQREKEKESITIIVDAVRYGSLTINPDTFELTQKLLFPIGESSGITELKYATRLNDLMLRPYLKNVDPRDADERLVAYIAALTSSNKGLLHHLVDVDKKVAREIVVFFT